MPSEPRYIQSAIEPRWPVIDTWLVNVWTRRQEEVREAYSRQEDQTRGTREWCHHKGCLRKTMQEFCYQHRPKTRVHAGKPCRWMYCDRNTLHESGICYDCRHTMWIMKIIEQEQEGEAC